MDSKRHVDPRCAALHLVLCSLPRTNNEDETKSERQHPPLKIAVRLAPASSARRTRERTDEQKERTARGPPGLESKISGHRLCAFVPGRSPRKMTEANESCSGYTNLSSPGHTARRRSKQDRKFVLHIPSFTTGKRNKGKKLIWRTYAKPVNARKYKSLKRDSLACTLNPCRVYSRRPR